jgi:endonuclease VIII
MPDYAGDMPEGDALRRAAQRLQVLVGQRVQVETPNPRAAAKHLVDRLDGKVLESVDAVGKNLLLRFEGGLVLQSHLRMTGRWRVEPRGAQRVGRPWLVLRGETYEGVLWNGPVLELRRDGGRISHLGPDILDSPPDFDAILARFASESRRRELGDALLDQRLVAGIGNLWKAEALWDVRVSPWRVLGDVSERELLAVLDSAHRLMRTSVEGTRPLRRCYRRAGRPCPRCSTLIRSWPQGDDARTAYWCPQCQRGGNEPAAAK